MNKLAVISLTLLLTSGCTSLNNLKKLNIDAGKGFNQALAKDYLEFSQSESDQYDFSNSGYFARKGIRAANGELVLPEELEKWDLPQKEIDNLKWARGRLMNVLTDKMRTDFPEKTAKAQSLFDCWIEQQEENWQKDDINACRSEFLLEVAELENKLIPEVIGNVTMEGREVPIPMPIDPLSKEIYFGSGSAKLNGNTTKSINEIVAQSKAMKSFMIKIDGYTDTVGSAEANMALSESRANSVANKFVEKGISQDSIEKHAHGETGLAKVTKDNVAEPLNRRVEVSISGAK
jgi:OOP family OmpA-OmpF porin